MVDTPACEANPPSAPGRRVRDRALDASALAVIKSKVGEAEFAWSTTGTGTGDDAECAKEDPETDAGRSLYSQCFSHSATVVYRFWVPAKARVRGFSFSFDGGGSFHGCYVLNTWVRRVSTHRVKVFFRHGVKYLDGNEWACSIHSVTIRYRIPS